MSFSTSTNRITAALFVTLASLSAASTGFAETEMGYGGRSGGHLHRPVRSHPVAFGYGHYHASTAGEGYLRGKAAVIDAVGDYEVNNGQAQILREEARALGRENNLKATEGLLAQKKMWSDARIQARKDRDARIAEGQQLLAKRRATIYRQAYQLTDSELNMKTGEISWPVALQDSCFQESRERMEELFRKHVGYGMPQADAVGEIARAVDQWSRSLTNEVSSMPKAEFLAAQKFLTGLKYSALAAISNS